MEIETMKSGTDTYGKEFNEYIEKEKAAIDLISSIGHLMYDKSIELVLFRNQLLDKGYIRDSKITSLCKRNCKQNNKCL